MNYKISTRFQRETQTVAEYIVDNFGKQYAMDFINDLHSNILNIVKYPEASAREPLLADRATEFRSKIVSKHNKAIYYIKDGTVYFTDLWDMRRNPDRLVKRIKKK